MSDMSEGRADNPRPIEPDKEVFGPKAPDKSSARPMVPPVGAGGEAENKEQSVNEPLTREEVMGILRSVDPDVQDDFTPEYYGNFLKQILTDPEAREKASNAPRGKEVVEYIVQANEELPDPAPDEPADESDLDTQDAAEMKALKQEANDVMLAVMADPENNREKAEAFSEKVKDTIAGYKDVLPKVGDAETRKKMKSHIMKSRIAKDVYLGIALILFLLLGATYGIASITANASGAQGRR